MSKKRDTSIPETTPAIEVVDACGCVNGLDVCSLPREHAGWHSSGSFSWGKLEEEPPPTEGLTRVEGDDLRAVFSGETAAPSLAVGDAVTVWPHIGDRGCFSGPHRGVVAKVHMDDCVDVTATVTEGREYERTFVGVVLAGSRGRAQGDAGTFTVA